ncbi:MAG: coproporphyrinogen dehydrogenase HemZ [Clostridia bacterium]|nr:coproporphyrinogen dehydrogenase HemZ [Clostridia bacterium]
MVRLITDTPQYANDIAEEIRMFLGLVPVTPDETPETELTLQTALDPAARIATARTAPDGEPVVIPYDYDETDPLDRKRQEKRALKRAVYALMQRIRPTKMPWGSLTGIRPTKLLRELCARVGEEEAVRQFKDVFSVRVDKLRLAATINAVQKPVIESVKERDLDVYIGIPYCKTRCLYCSFGAELAKPDAVEEYLPYLFRDIENGARLTQDAGYAVRALYIGGGTPTVLSAEQLDVLLTYYESTYGTYGAECTVEAGRPDTITKEKLDVLRRHGVDRISINPQTMSDETLRRIGRLHTAAQIRDAFALARSMGFSSINMDLIAGLPGETVPDFERTLSEIKALRPDNLTVHTLAIKRSSRLKDQLDRYPLPSRADVETMIDLGFSAAKEIGLWPYYMYRQKYQNGNLENVGYAANGKLCIYNVDMMEETTSILAHGAGAMTKRVFFGQNRVERIPNPKDVPTYGAKLDLLDRQKRAMFFL